MNVQNDNNAFLREAARVAYGSRFFEKQNGGYGSIGVLKDPYGRDRIVKFNTRYWEEGEVTNKMLEVSNSLREKLWGIAKEMPQLRGARREEIRNLLNIDRRGKSGTTELLKRTIVARVITKIGGQRLWDEALAEKSIKSYRSTGLSTKFQAVYDAAAGVGNDARRSLANGVLIDAMKSVIAAIPGNDTLHRAIRLNLEKLLTDDVRRRLADTKGGGKEICKACQAFIRQNALRLACMYIDQNDENSRDAEEFVRAYLGLAPGANVSRKLGKLGYLQNAQSLRTVYDELGEEALLHLLVIISEHTAEKWKDEDPLRASAAEAGLRVQIPLAGGRTAECQMSGPLCAILRENDMLDGDSLATGLLLGVASRAAIRQRDLAKKHYKAIRQQNELILKGMRENMIELENEKKALKMELEEYDEYNYTEDLKIWKNLLKNVNGNNMNIVNVQNVHPVLKKAGKQVVQHNVVQHNVVQHNVVQKNGNKNGSWHPVVNLQADPENKLKIFSNAPEEPNNAQNRNVIKSNSKGKGAVKQKGVVKQKNVVKQKFENPFMADLSPEDLAEIEGSRNT